MSKTIDLTGQKFGRLTVIEKSHTSGHGQLHWRSICECGKEKICAGANLRKGLTRSCGCLVGDTARALYGTHMLTGHPLYEVWLGMRKRCYNKNTARYKDYGGRGIIVCERWQKFENFYEDMLPSWKEGLSIDRKDVNGNYDADNCQWLPMALQAKNKQNSTKVETPWGIMSVTDAAKRAGMDRVPFMWRMKHWPKENWFDEKRPGKHFKRRIAEQG